MHRRAFLPNDGAMFYLKWGTKDRYTQRGWGEPDTGVLCCGLKLKHSCGASVRGGGGGGGAGGAHWPLCAPPLGAPLGPPLGPADPTPEHPGGPDKEA